MKQGVRIGEWELVRQLNSGGMGHVWQARRVFVTGDARIAAIKLLKPSGVLDERSRTGLLKEAGIQMKFLHPNIPKVIDVGVHEGLPFMVMDYISGRDLSQFLARQRQLGSSLDCTLAAHIIREVAYALEYAHAFKIDNIPQEIVHRDIAPKNIMLSGQGDVFVLDFGVAEAKSHETSRNYVKGTLLYMAPEHALGFPCPASDAFGLGASLWEMLENRVFRAEVASDDLRKAVNEGWVPPLTRRDIDDVLRFIVEGLLRKNPDDRLKIADVIEYVESPEFPAQRKVLAREVQRSFGAAVLGSGQTLHDFNFSDELEQTLAAGAVAKRSTPLLGGVKKTWGQEAFDHAGAPVVVATQSTRPVVPQALGDDDDSRPLTVEPPAGEDTGSNRSSAPSHEAESTVVEPAATRLEPRRRDDGGAVEPRIATELLAPAEMDLPDRAVFVTERLPPPVGQSAPSPRVHDRTTPAPLVSAATQAPSVPPVLASAMVHGGAQHPRGRRGVVALSLVAVSAVGLGIWALSTVGGGGEVSHVAETPPVVPVASAADVAPREHASVVPEAPPADEPPRATAVAVGTPEPTSAPAVESPPIPSPTEPESPEEPEEPAAEPEPTTPVAKAPRPRKAPPVPRSTINVAIGFVTAMDISIDGTRRSLTMRGTDRAKFKVRPGRRVVRWGPPGRPLKNSKRVTIVAGTDYKVHLSSGGPTFDAIKKEAP